MSCTPYEQLLTRLRWFGESEPGMLAFDERYITVLQRLLVEHARPERADRALTWSERSALLTSRLAIPGVVTNRAPDRPLGEGATVEEVENAWTAFVVQGGAYYESADLADAMARAYALYCELPAEPVLAAHHDPCPFDEWMIAGVPHGVRGN